MQHVSAIVLESIKDLPIVITSLLRVSREIYPT